MGAVWVTEIAVESELVTASRIDAFIVEARRTLGQHPMTDHWGLSGGGGGSRRGAVGGTPGHIRGGGSGIVSSPPACV